ncbi:hypothetical protein [Lentzea aerocolonigenes]|uniref:hypothetical protein n=1 Tax=Lentzea aerocolonigenes TaxID=68170 RepID=UPI0006979CFC|nr:hypothetical protein [Lentzea aerocolonigenes]
MRSENFFSKSVPTVATPPRLADGRPPRGLTGDGLVRTTGWLQAGDHPVSSVYVAAAIGFLWAPIAAVKLMASVPVAAGVLVIAAPALSGTAWWLFTTRVRPSSLARNTGEKCAKDLEPGDVVRLHGSIGPVGQVIAVTPAGVDFYGGGSLSWAPGDVVQIAELLT